MAILIASAISIPQPSGSGICVCIDDVCRAGRRSRYRPKELLLPSSVLSNNWGYVHAVLYISNAVVLHGEETQLHTCISYVHASWS